jgi:RNA polymerase sporulation-specific sigma factor
MDTNVTALNAGKSKGRRGPDTITKDKEALFHDNQGLVKFVLRRNGIQTHSQEYDDYLQVGYIGLFKAARNYNPEYGCVFSTYAVPKIESEIRRERRDNGFINISRPIRSVYYHYNKLLNKGHTVEEILKILRVDEEELNRAIVAMQPVAYLNEQVHEDSDTTFTEYLVDDNNLQDECMNELVVSEKFKLFNQNLSDTENKILELRLAGKVQKEISKIIGVSQVQVSRRLKVIVKRLIEINGRYESGEAV